MDNQNFIEYYDGLVSPKDCKDIIDTFDMYVKMGYGGKRPEDRGLDFTDEYTFVPPNRMKSEITEKALGNIAGRVTDIIYNAYDFAYNQYITKYPALRGCARHIITNPKLQKTEPGQGYHVWHYESNCIANATTVLVWTVYLNEEFDAGETEFLHQGVRVKPKTGRFCLFPASFTHTHRGNPPIGGTKYIATGWVDYVE